MDAYENVINFIDYNKEEKVDDLCSVLIYSTNLLEENKENLSLNIIGYMIKERRD